MRKEPQISIGILQDKTVLFSFSSPYWCKGEMLTGLCEVFFQEGKIHWKGKSYEELFFEPAAEQSSFILHNVTIGINFHWERKEDQEFQGSLKLIVGDRLIIAINVLPVENYLLSVISSEMSVTASPELLKAHAVISRSWVLAQIEKNKEQAKYRRKCPAFIENENERIRWYDKEDHTCFDVCADDHCQRYQGIIRASANLSAVEKAVKETRGEVLMFEEKICDARFSKSCGGVVEEFQNTWENVRHPYLTKLRDDVDTVSDCPDLTNEPEAGKWIQSSPSAFCNTRDEKILNQVLNNYDRETSDFYRWSVSYSQEELSDLINRRSGIDFGQIEDLIPVKRGTSGRLIKLKIVGSKRTVIIGKELEIRRILSRSHLLSSAFIVKKNNTSFLLLGAGWGHGVGLCQIGAAVMGEQGYSYQQILLHYYTGAETKILY
jgi:SpoIID/LytB domain protein